MFRLGKLLEMAKVNFMTFVLDTLVYEAVI